VGSVRDLRPKRYGASGRIAELEVVGTLGTTTLKGLAIRRALGIRENLFFFDAQHAPDGTVRGWVFTGRVWGHGVGMCQVGAYGMAAEGFSYREILSHYYPGTRIDNHRSRP
jgi:stage II sporulation protein D